MGAHVAKFKRFSRNPTANLKNVEKILDEKIVSPRHPTTVKAFDKLVKEHPEFEQSAKQKNDHLHEMLNSVRVNSTGAAPTEVLKSGKRARKLEAYREGKLTNEQIVDLFINRKIAPESWTVEKIAEDYKLDEDVARNLHQFFSSFYIYKQEKDALAIGSGKAFYQRDGDVTKQ